MVEEYEDSSPIKECRLEEEEEKVDSLVSDVSEEEMVKQPLLIQYYPLDLNLIRPDLFRRSSLDSPSRNEDLDDRLSNQNLKKRSSAMESSLKFKFMGEDPSFEFQIVSTMNDSQNKILVQPGNHKILKVDELDVVQADDVVQKDELEIVQKEVQKEVLDESRDNNQLFKSRDNNHINKSFDLSMS